MIKIKRIYEEADKSDGTRILVDRLRPRGLSRDIAKVDIWLKDIAPGDELRKWFSHEPEKWAMFKRRYLQELEGKQEQAALLKEKAQGETVTLLYGTKEEKYNNAAALKEYLDTFHMKSVSLFLFYFKLFLPLCLHPCGTFPVEIEPWQERCSTFRSNAGGFTFKRHAPHERQGDGS